MELFKKLKTAGAIAAIGGGSLVAGSQVGKPACDYAFVSGSVGISVEKEICLTTEQAEFIVDNLKGKNTGFGKSQFSDLNLEKK